MTDNVLQSFCERCGTRYTSSAPEPPPASEESKSRLGRFGRRSSEKPPAEERPSASMTSPSSEAFAGTFHFCMDCREYVCTKCWNVDAGGCLTDRPLLGQGDAVGGEAATRSPFAAGTESTMWPTGDTFTVGSTSRSSAGVELDEWGRPRKAEPPKAADETTKPAFEPQVDPWRGVVFSDSERAALEPPPDAPPAATSPATPAPTIDFRAERGVDEPANPGPRKPGPIRIGRGIPWQADPASTPRGQGSTNHRSQNRSR